MTVSESGSPLILIGSSSGSSKSASVSGSWLISPMASKCWSNSVRCVPASAATCICPGRSPRPQEPHACGSASVGLFEIDHVIAGSHGGPTKQMPVELSPGEWYLGLLRRGLGAFDRLCPSSSIGPLHCLFIHRRNPASEPRVRDSCSVSAAAQRRPRCSPRPVGGCQAAYLVSVFPSRSTN